MLNPLHRSINAAGQEEGTHQTTFEVKRSRTASKSRKAKAISKDKHVTKLEAKSAAESTPAAINSDRASADLCRSTPTPDASVPQNDLKTVPASQTNAGTAYARNADTGEVIPVALSEIGKASRFGDETLCGTNKNKCNVFEVVLQSKEATMCPACARSSRRARLPAHARGRFGLS
jgi:hypothetical protein